MINRLKDQSAFYGEIRIEVRRTWSSSRLRVMPRRDRVFVEPHGEAAAVDQRTIVCTPITDETAEHSPSMCHRPLITARNREEICNNVARLRQAEDMELETISHMITEPAVTRLTTSHPDMAAKLSRALGWRMLAAKKSKYYEVAVAHFAQAKLCYEESGLDSAWQALVATVRRTHGRKYSFMPAFERIVAGQAPPPQVSFLERARQRGQHN